MKTFISNKKIGYWCTMFLALSILVLPTAIIYAQGSVGGQTTPGQVGGQTTPPSTGTAHLTNPLKVTSIGALIESGVEIFTYVAVLFGVVMFVVVGLQYILARGNMEKMKEASKTLLAIVIGVAIVIGARVAVSIIINTLSATGAVSPGVIQSAQNAIRP